MKNNAIFTNAKVDVYMSKIFHITSIECAKNIIAGKTIFGADCSEQSHEAYPHFFHCEYGRSNAYFPNGSEIELYFNCDLPEKITEYSPPEPDRLNVHFDGDTFWQCTIHPDTRSSLKFVGWKVLDQVYISEDDKNFFEELSRMEVEVKVIWQRQHYAILIKRKNFRQKINQIFNFFKRP
ncbi:hypothetical protein [Thalassospira sp.]|uniref:hypothetical protein n=1 Tax=Thalassospira sp. TaxID=1912094 RepID=UPI0026360348|nr:hypothetical protein [Thalassospira sp.]MCH2276942.1 hypothetical protein [Thalassospira sp.]